VSVLDCDSEVRDNFCSGPGKATNMVKFYVWMTLKGVDLLCVSHVPPSDVPGDGIGYGSGCYTGRGDESDRPRGCGRQQR
jgi:hypothetical protein